jgi:hypothetical protein
MSEDTWTMPIVEFGRHFYGLSKSGSYAAARNGDIPATKIGGKWLGLVRVAKEQLTKHEPKRATDE